MPVSDVQYAALIDRVVACREAEDRAKAETKALYAEIAEAGEDKTAVGLLVRELRMSNKDRVKADIRDAAVEDGRIRYRRGKASHVRAREGRSTALSALAALDADIIGHDADGVVIESGPTAGTSHGGDHETHGVAKTLIDDEAAKSALGLSAAVNCDDDMADGADPITGGGPGVSASDVEPVAPHFEPQSGSGMLDTSAQGASELTSSDPQRSDGAKGNSARAEAPDHSNITQLHRLNPSTHFANSKGLPRLHGCMNPEACGGSHRALCFSCSVEHDGPAYQGGAA